MLVDANFLIRRGSDAFERAHAGPPDSPRTEAYAFELPDGLSPIPEVYGIVQSDAPRNITFRPFGLEPDPARNPGLRLVARTTNSGMSVSVYRSLEERSTRIAYWTLPNGYLQTFTDDRFRCSIDTTAAMSDLLRDLEVGVSDTALPAVELHGELWSGNPRDPDLRESIVFTPVDARMGWPLIQVFREPAWVPRGTTRWDHPEWSARAETNDLNLTVQVQGPRAESRRLEQIVDQVVSSATPLF